MNRSQMHRALLAVGCALAMVMLSVPAAFDALDQRFPPPLAQAADTSFEVVDREGRLLRAFANEDGRWRLELDLDQVDPRFIEMLLAYEDKRYWDHPGVDTLALGRAVWQCVRYRRIVSGGSTITMQLARLMEPGDRRTLAAKLLQIFRALQFEQRLDKTEILRLYLTHAPYGGNIEGLRAAALAYFGREPSHLTPAMAAMLVALPQAPEARRPDRHADAARAARDRVLQRLVKSGTIEQTVAAAAMKRPAPTGRLALPGNAPHLSRELATATRGARRVATTLDAELQMRLETLTRDHIGNNAALAGRRVSSAILVADSDSGEILAHIGSPDPFDAARHGAIDMTAKRRSPGSTLKPLIYGIGFESGLIAPDTLIDDRPSDFTGYTPDNFDRSFQGTVTVRE
ncbi:MAG: penicillin-binding protein 1C, partial [Rhizobiales bacterium]|nr:penicillin-binding protein 1C [Hyphomicrobiales bacterium]